MKVAALLPSHSRIFGSSSAVWVHTYIASTQNGLVSLLLHAL